MSERSQLVSLSRNIPARSRRSGRFAVLPGFRRVWTSALSGCWRSGNLRQRDGWDWTILSPARRAVCPSVHQRRTALSFGKSNCAGARQSDPIFVICCTRHTCVRLSSVLEFISVLRRYKKMMKFQRTFNRKSKIL